MKLILIMATLTMILAGCSGPDSGLSAKIVLTPPQNGTTPPTSDNSSTSPGGELSQHRQNLIRLVNEVRLQAGLSELTLEEDRTAVAQAHAQDMVLNNLISHTGSDGSSPFDRLDNAGISFNQAGENIASGFLAAEDVMVSWMNSSSHRLNILNPSYKRLGIGYSQGAWVQVFTD